MLVLLHWEQSNDLYANDFDCPINSVDLFAGKSWEIKSPSKQLKLTVSESEGAIRLVLSSTSGVLVEVSTSRFVIANGQQVDHYLIDDVIEKSVNQSWQPLYGERKTIGDRYHEVAFSLINEDNLARHITLCCRVYDEGIAFRQTFDSAYVQNVFLQKELTSFHFSADYEAWTSSRAQSEILKTTIDKIVDVVERPLVVKQEVNSFLALGEAGLVDFARMKFVSDSSVAHTLSVHLEDEVNLKLAGYKTPWIYVMAARSPGKLLENNFFILNLNEANQIKDPSWIKPGKIIREVTLTTDGGIACVDFAARHHLQFVEFDAGWYGPENDVNSDASTITVDPKRSAGPLDLHRVIEYAQSKDIGIILYVNHLALEQQLDQILPLYKSWGIRGVKYGFVNVGAQKWTTWLHDAVRKAAEYQLMVDVHDEYRPTGYSRTYPNLMTQEGIRGDEESPSIKQTLQTVFTRMIAGAGDYTNCYFAPRVSEKMGGESGQMAKAIMLYSPWQFLYWYDRPEGSPRKKGGAGSSEGVIQEEEALLFYDQLPTVWDETRVLEGEIGSYATIARKSGTDWFVGSLTADEEHRLHLPLNFLDKGSQYEVTFYQQDEQSRLDREVQIEKMIVNRKTTLEKKLLANSGLAIILRKI